jgi:endonuclease YncB( thermonuclease family)
MVTTIDTRRQSESSRPFVQGGCWSNPMSCDPQVQRKATLRVSMLAGLITLGLMAAPDLRLSNIDKAIGPSIILAAPEIVAHPMPVEVASAAATGLAPSLTEKGSERVPALEEITSSAPTKMRLARSETDLPSVIWPKSIALDYVEIIDPQTVRTGDQIMRLSGIVAPKEGEMCKRLDGLAVACLDRALSYLQLLVKGRMVACTGDKLENDSLRQGRCRMGETDLAEQLVRQGWARAGALPEERIVMAEAAAKQQKLGIWRQLASLNVKPRPSKGSNMY